MLDEGRAGQSTSNLQSRELGFKCARGAGGDIIFATQEKPALSVRGGLRGEHEHVGGRVFECPAGSFVFVPKGTVHTFRTLDGGSRKLNLYTPAAMVGYFDELAEGIARGMSEGDLDAIAGRYAMDIIGPVPESYLEPS